MQRGDGRERSPAVAFPRGPKIVVTVFSPGGRAISFGQERYHAFGSWLRAPTTITLVVATAVRLRLKAIGATGVRKG